MKILLKQAFKEYFKAFYFILVLVDFMRNELACHHIDINYYRVH